MICSGLSTARAKRSQPRPAGRDPDVLPIPTTRNRTI